MAVIFDIENHKCDFLQPFSMHELGLYFFVFLHTKWQQSQGVLYHSDDSVIFYISKTKVSHSTMTENFPRGLIYMTVYINTQRFIWSCGLLWIMFTSLKKIIEIRICYNEKNSTADSNTLKNALTGIDKRK